MTNESGLAPKAAPKGCHVPFTAFYRPVKVLLKLPFPSFSPRELYPLCQQWAGAKCTTTREGFGPLISGKALLIAILGYIQLVVAVC